MEDPSLRGYRRVVTAFVLVGALIAAVVGGWLLLRGQGFPAFLALCVVGFLVLLVHGYRQDEEERNRPRRPAPPSPPGTQDRGPGGR